MLCETSIIKKHHVALELRNDKETIATSSARLSFLLHLAT